MTDATSAFTASATKTAPINAATKTPKLAKKLIIDQKSTSSTSKHYLSASTPEVEIQTIPTTIKWSDPGISAGLYILTWLSVVVVLVVLIWVLFCACKHFEKYVHSKMSARNASNVLKTVVPNKPSPKLQIHAKSSNIRPLKAANEKAELTNKKCSFLKETKLSESQSLPLVNALSPTSSEKKDFVTISLDSSPPPLMASFKPLFIDTNPSHQKITPANSPEPKKTAFKQDSSINLIDLRQRGAPSKNPNDLLPPIGRGRYLKQIELIEKYGSGRGSGNNF